MDLRQFDEVEATFQPKVLTTLRDSARPLIGTRQRWRCLWVIEDEDGGPYVGQHAWEEATHQGPYLGWVPTEDLDDIVLVKRLSEGVPSDH